MVATIVKANGNGRDVSKASLDLWDRQLQSEVTRHGGAVLPLHLLTRLVRVTPDLAAAWLVRNSQNRPVNRKAVEKYKRIIRAGLWRPTHQGIALDELMSTIDGQHRLLAIVETGIDIELLVFVGVPAAWQWVMDRGQERDLGDAVRGMYGATMDTFDKSITRKMYTGIDEFPTKWLPDEEMANFYQQHVEAIKFVKDRLGRKSKARRAAVSAVLARAYYSVPSENLQRFIEVLENGIARDPHDETVIRLRDLISQTKGVQTRVFYRKTVNALDKWLRGETVKRNLHEAPREVFLLPGEE